VVRGRKAGKDQLLDNWERDGFGKLNIRSPKVRFAAGDAGDARCGRFVCDRIAMMRGWSCALRRIAGLVRAREGGAAVEFSVAAPILAIIFVPLIDLGMGIYQQMQVQDAAQAGAQYAMAHGWNSSAIQSAVTSATGLTISASPAPSKSCGCPDGSSVSAAACGSTCADGLTAGTYVTVGAQATYVPLLPYPTMGSSVTLSAQATARIQ
jgi:Flp pilus assembly protein TadG